jgi:DNA primase
MKNLPLLTFILLFLAPDVSAGQSIMKYTSLGAKKPAPESSNTKTLYNRQIEPAAGEETEAASEEAVEETPAEETKTPEQTIWDKYRELATGRTEDAPADASQKPEAPEKPEAPSKQAKGVTTNHQPPAGQPTGIAGLLSEYQRNKEKRSQMRTINIRRPETPKTEKPSVEKPKRTDTND